ncbi:MAG TPA: CDP-alcohol phosphatidyltransferase family protein [Anaerolineales bacterium]|jgi:phosphatidylglycerophosphate synthase|nr:CDP-alcohol phosphatidyltransferase family protein [Anaerolineales bacterium]
MKEKKTDHVRINDILLGPIERPALQYFCKIAPSWATPDTMTLIGIFGAIMIAAGYILTWYNMAFLWLASFGFLVNWYGDSMDGSLARYRKIERPKYGYYVDHIVDVTNEFIVILALGISPLVNFEIAAIALIGYLMLSAHTFLKTYVDDVFQISFGKLGPTEVRVLIIIFNTIVYFLNNPDFGTYFGITLSLFDFLILIIAFLLFFFYTTSTIQTSIDLARKGE